MAVSQHGLKVLVRTESPKPYLHPKPRCNVEFLPQASLSCVRLAWYIVGGTDRQKLLVRVRDIFRW